MSMTDHTESPTRWPLERVLFALAGTITLLAVALGASVSPWFLALGVLVGVNQWAYVLVRACPASIVLRRAFGLRSAIYPNPSETLGAHTEPLDVAARTPEEVTV